MKDQTRSTDSDVYSLVMYTELLLGLTKEKLFKK